MKVFDDPLAKFVQDRIVNGEERWQVIGITQNWVLAVVAHTSREVGDVEIVRIISARTADRDERRLYEFG